MERPLKLTFLADTHYYSKSLGVSGRQYELRSGSDQKCLAETEEIITAAFEEIGNSDTDAVMIAGDLTNDGERVCHEEFRKLARGLAQKKPLYLITATHDWCCDGNPRRYDGDMVFHDVPTLSSESLYDFYRDFGPKQAISVFQTHLGTASYVIALSGSVWLLALIDDQNGKGRAGFFEEHFLWIEEQLRRAQEQGILVIGMEHHLLLPHVSSLFTGGACVGDREAVASRLADAGLRYMVAGHSHIQHTKRFVSKKGNALTEINVGSLCGYPGPICEITVQPDQTLFYEVRHLASFRLGGEEIDAQRFFKRHATAMIRRVWKSPDRREFTDRLTALQLPGKKIGRFYGAIRPVLQFIRTADLGRCYRLLKRLGLARGIQKEWVLAYERMPLTEVIDGMMCSFLDGAYEPHSRNSAYYQLVMGAVSIPSRLFPKNGDLQKLIDAADEILAGGEINAQRAKI